MEGGREREGGQGAREEGARGGGGERRAGGGGKGGGGRREGGREGWGRDPNEGEALRRGSTFKPGGLAPPTPCSTAGGGRREGGGREDRLIISVSWLSTTETHAFVTSHFR